MSDAPGFAPFEDVGIAERDKPPFMRLPSPETLFGLRALRRWRPATSSRRI